MDIKNLELTDEDFKLIVSGLDALPQKDLAGEMIGDIMLNMIDGGDPVAKERAKVERERRAKQKAVKNETLVEDIRILQGKLLQFKRWLIEQNALKQTNDILSKR